MSRELKDRVDLRTDSHIREIRPDTYAYVFGPYADPITTVHPGDTVDVFTEDAFGGRVRTVADLPTQVCVWPFLNPQTGPIYIEGAEPGDTLAIEILEIEPTRDFVCSALIPNMGGLTGTTLTATLNDPLPEQVFIYPLRDRHIHLPRGIKLPYEPFLGTIATSPQIEAITSLAPGPFGGNMDVPDVCPGNTVRLPVWVTGAFFYLGDVHAAQGDGELCGVACEVSARTRIRFDLEKGRTIRWPRIESTTELMTVGSSRPMEDAARIAWAELVGWLANDYGFDRFEAYQLLTQAGRMRIGNMVDPQYSLVAKIDKKYLVDGAKELSEQG